MPLKDWVTMIDLCPIVILIPCFQNKSARPPPLKEIHRRIGIRVAIPLPKISYQKCRMDNFNFSPIFPNFILLLSLYLASVMRLLFLTYILKINKPLNMIDNLLSEIYCQKSIVKNTSKNSN